MLRDVEMADKLEAQVMTMEARPKLAIMVTTVADKMETIKKPPCRTQIVKFLRVKQYISFRKSSILFFFNFFKFSLL